MTSQLKHKKMEVEQIVNIMIKMTEGLLFLHTNRIIHANLSLASFVKCESEIKLTDLEKSFLLLESNNKKVSFEPYEDSFRPLETFKLSECGFKTDIWALGCSFCELLYGKNLFPFQLDYEQYVSCLESWIDGSKNTNGEEIEIPKSWIVPEYFNLNSLILKMINPDKSKRPTIFDVKRILMQNLEEELSSSPPDVISFIRFMSEYKVCFYNENSIIGTTKIEILSRLDDYDSIFKKLVMSIYENVCSSHGFNIEHFETSKQLAFLFTGEKFEIDENKFMQIITQISQGREFFSLCSFIR